MTRAESSQSKKGAAHALGGASGGTALVALADILGPTTRLGELLTIVAPALTVGLGYVAYYLHLKADKYFAKQRAETERAERAARDEELNAARDLLEKCLSNPHTSTAHKARIRKQLEDLDKFAAEHAVSQVRKSYSEHGQPVHIPAPDPG